MAMGAPADTGADADHVCKRGNRAQRVGRQRVELDFQRIRDAETGCDQLRVNPVYQRLWGLGGRGDDVVVEEECEVLGRGVGFGEDLGVPVVDGEFAGCFCVGVRLCFAS